MTTFEIEEPTFTSFPEEAEDQGPFFTLHFGDAEDYSWSTIEEHVDTEHRDELLHKLIGISGLVDDINSRSYDVLWYTKPTKDPSYIGFFKKTDKILKPARQLWKKNPKTKAFQAEVRKTLKISGKKLRTIHQKADEEWQKHDYPPPKTWPP